jgi:5'-3' exonuclease
LAGGSDEVDAACSAAAPGDASAAGRAGLDGFGTAALVFAVAGVVALALAGLGEGVFGAVAFAAFPAGAAGASAAAAAAGAAGVVRGRGARGISREGENGREGANRVWSRQAGRCTLTAGAVNPQREYRPMSRLLVLDGPNLLMRAHHVAPGPDLVRAMLQRVLRHVRPTHLVVALDSQGPTLRAQAFAGYKASRLERGGVRSSEVVAALLPSLEAWGVALARAEGHEADDVMATLAARGVAAGSVCVLGSNDSDVLQVASAAVCVLRAENGGAFRSMTPEAVLERKGVLPHQICDLKALAGDTADDIPRVAQPVASGRMMGLTPAHAAELLRRFGSLEGVYDAIPLLPARQGGWLEACREQAFFFRELVRLRQDVELDGLDPRLAAVRHLALPGGGRTP